MARRRHGHEHSRSGGLLGDSQMTRRLLTAGAVLLSVVVLTAQQPLDMSKLGVPPTDNWPTYNGDYTGRRFSTLSQINQENVKHLTLAWVNRIKVGPTNRAIIG